MFFPPALPVPELVQGPISIEDERPYSGSSFFLYQWENLDDASLHELQSWATVNSGQTFIDWEHPGLESPAMVAISDLRIHPIEGRNEATLVAFILGPIDNKGLN